jgi:UDP-N-acetyl-D-mannosaminuronic acid dehydrogenase
VSFSRDVVIVGGCGHVGLPLGLALADQGLSVALYDINENTVRMVSSGQLPFAGPGADPVLARVLGRTLIATKDPSVISTAECLVVVIGTPIDSERRIQARRASGSTLSNRWNRHE